MATVNSSAVNTGRGCRDCDTLISLHMEAEMFITAVDSRIMVDRERLGVVERKGRQRRPDGGGVPAVAR